MTQREKARDVLDRLFFQPRYVRTGVSEKFLREYAAKKWGGRDDPLEADVLIDEAEARVLAGELSRFNRGVCVIYKLPAKRQFTPPSAHSDQKQNEQPENVKKDFSRRRLLWQSISVKNCFWIIRS